MDARVSLLESVFIIVDIHLGRQAFRSDPTIGASPSHVRPVPTHDVPRPGAADLNWSQLDQFNVEEIFLIRVPMLRSCPHHLRGRLWECLGLALRERFRARFIGDVESETRAWKLFELIPMMLLHKPKGTGSVGRSELARRFDLFARGSQLIHKVQNNLSEKQEQERRGKAAQNRVQQGQPGPGRS